MKLYYSPGSCSLIAHCALETAGATFETERLDLTKGDQRKPEYLKINPKAKVPTLVLDDGTVLTEVPAIVSYVADLFPAAGLLAPPSQVARAKAQEWMAWCASTVHPAFGALFAAMGQKRPPAAAERDHLQLQLDRYDQWLAGKRFVLGDRFSGADPYTLVFARWTKLFDMRVGGNMRASAKAVAEQPGVQRALAAQGIQADV